MSYKKQVVNYDAWIKQMCNTFGLKYDPEAPSHALEQYFYKLHKQARQLEDATAWTRIKLSYIIKLLSILMTGFIVNIVILLVLVKLGMEAI